MTGNRSSLFPHPPSRAPSSALLLVTIGALGIVSQIVLLRELMAACGGNEFSVGVTVATWILCEALGAWLAGRTSCIVHRRSFLSALSILSSLAAVPAAVLIRPVLGVLPGETLSIPLLLLATFAVVLLPAAAHGALFVTAAAHRTQGIGSAYVWEGAGTVLAGISVFLLLSRFPSLSLVALSALPLVVAVGVGHGLTQTRWTTLTFGSAALVSLALVVFGLPVEKLAWGAAWRGQRVTAAANSPYGKIVRLERAGQQLILYDGLPVLTVPSTAIERIEELALLPVLVHPAPRRVLVIGDDLAVPAALARFRPDLEVTAVQLDPWLAHMSLSALSSDSSLLPLLFSLTTADPVAFLKTSRDTFDCIVLTDAAPTSLGSSRLFAAEFYQHCRQRLAPGGILATPGPGNPTGLSPDLIGLLATRLRTLKTAFGHVLPVAADFPILVASNRPFSVATETLTSRLDRLSATPRLLDSSYVTGLLDPFRQHALASALEPGAGNPGTGTSSAASPRELYLNMVRENRLVSPAFGAFYARLGSSSIVRRLSFFSFIVLATLLAVGLVGTFSRGHSFGRGFAILTSGFSGAAVSSLLIFAWQVRFGSVFSGVSLLVAAFMLGTVAGGSLGKRRFHVPRPSSLVLSFVVSDIALMSCAAAVPALTRGGPAGFLVTANCLAGACLGFQFALAGSIIRRPSFVASAPQSAVRRAGVLTALDLAGGSLGGMLTALFVVPVFGIGVAALFAGAVKLASALVQLTPKRRTS